MKSHPRAGQFKLRGKKSVVLSCGCCDAADLREKDGHPKRTLEVALADSILRKPEQKARQWPICPACKKPFAPINQWQKACSMACAMTHNWPREKT